MKSLYLVFLPAGWFLRITLHYAFVAFFFVSTPSRKDDSIFYEYDFFTITALCFDVKYRSPRLTWEKRAAKRIERWFITSKINVCKNLLHIVSDKLSFGNFLTASGNSGLIFLIINFGLLFARIIAFKHLLSRLLIAVFFRESCQIKI